MLADYVLPMGSARTSATKLVHRLKARGVETDVRAVRKELDSMMRDGLVSYSDTGTPRWGRVRQADTLEGRLAWSVRVSWGAKLVAIVGHPKIAAVVANAYGAGTVVTYRGTEVARIAVTGAPLTEPMIVAESEERDRVVRGEQVDLQEGT